MVLAALFIGYILAVIGIHILLLLVGLAGLAAGGHFLVHWTVKLAHRWEVRPVFLSILVLGMGTSAPEWFATVISAFKGYSDVALGNVIGSNIANVLLILGGVGIFCPQKEEEQIKRFSLPFLLFSFVCLFVLFLDGTLSRVESFFLFILFALYLFLLFRKAKAPRTEEAPARATEGKLWLQVSGVLFGFLLLFVGSKLAITSSVFIGQAFGLSEKFIGLFFVSIGTSLPELSAAVASLVKKQEEMVLGNVVGSNLFNTLFVLSSAGLLLPMTGVQKFFMDCLLMFCACFLLLVFLIIFRRLPRPAAFLFFMAYGLYLYFAPAAIL